MRSFNWILPGLLAGSGRPGLLGDLEEEVRWLSAAGIRHVVSLTRQNLQLPVGCGLNQLHFPIPDMGIPTPRATLELCREVLAAIARKEPVLLHCKAGLGRTGTLLACVLVSLGDDSARAITRVRKVSTHYIQALVQESFVGHYAEFLHQLDSRGELPDGFRPVATPTHSARGGPA